MFVELFPLLKKKGMVVLTACRVSDTHMRVSLHPHAEDEDDKPDLVPVAFEGTPAELDAAGIDFTPAVETKPAVNEQIKESAAAGKASAAPAKAPAPAKSTSRTAAAAPAKSPKAAPAKSPANAPVKTAAQIAEEKAKKDADDAKAKADADAKKQADAEAKKKADAKAKRDKELAELRAKLASLETEGEPASEQPELPPSGGS